MATKTETRTEKVHFVIDGPWFTWLLRHLWIEGSESKAIRTWCAAFPELSKKEHLTGVFVDVVNGTKKFTGKSDDKNGFKLAKDGSKFWSTVAGGKPSKNFPLLQSWDDVLLKKKGELFMAEMCLSHFRVAREKPDNFSGCDHNALTWSQGAVENEVENRLRSQVSALWAESRNLSNVLGLDMTIPELPTNEVRLDTIRRSNVSGPGRKTDGEYAADFNKKSYDYAISVLEPVRIYFTKKYGTKVFSFSDQDIRFYCGYDEESIATRDRLKREKEGRENLERLGNRLNLVSQAMGVPDVTTFVKKQIESRDRKTIESEDVCKTQWDSGYIDREGKFYGCAFYDHVNFSERLAGTLGLKDEKLKNAERLLEKLGFVKVSRSRFYWEESAESLKLTDAQKQTMRDYMAAKKKLTAVFNGVNEVSFEEGIGENP